VLRALAERNAIDTAAVDDVIWSTSVQKWQQGSDLGRMSALLAGYDVRASGVTLDRFCGGGITTVTFGAAQIRSDMEDVIIVGGTEMMSYHQVAAAIEAAAGIKPLGTHAGNPELIALQPFTANGVAADAIAAQEGITRAATDAIGFESQRRAARAIREGRFARSVVAVHNPDGSLALDHEEYPGPETTLESLATLKPSFAATRDLSLVEDGTILGLMI